MIINSVRIIPDRSGFYSALPAITPLEFNFATGAINTSNFIFDRIEGLESLPMKFDTSTIGRSLLDDIFIDFQYPSRNIVFYIDYNRGSKFGDARDFLYQRHGIIPGQKVNIEVGVKITGIDSTRTLEIKGIIEEISSSVFSNDVKFFISIYCPDGRLTDRYETPMSQSGQYYWDTKATAISDVNISINTESISSNINSILIYSGSTIDSYQQFELIGPIEPPSNNMIRINSVNKSVTSGGVSIFERINPDKSFWPVTKINRSIRVVTNPVIPTGSIQGTIRQSYLGV